MRIQTTNRQLEEEVISWLGAREFSAQRDYNNSSISESTDILIHRPHLVCIDAAVRGSDNRTRLLKIATDTGTRILISLRFGSVVPYILITPTPNEFASWPYDNVFAWPAQSELATFLSSPTVSDSFASFFSRGLPGSTVFSDLSRLSSEFPSVQQHNREPSTYTDSYIEIAGRYVLMDFENLCKPDELETRLRQLHQDPQSLFGANISQGEWTRTDVWLIPFLVEIIALSTGTPRGYSRSKLIAESMQVEESLTGSTFAPRGPEVLARQFSTWISRRNQQPLPATVLQAVSSVLASRLSDVGKSRVEEIIKSGTFASIDQQLAMEAWQSQVERLRSELSAHGHLVRDFLVRWPVKNGVRMSARFDLLSVGGKQLAVRWQSIGTPALFLDRLKKFISDSWTLRAASSGDSPTPCLLLNYTRTGSKDLKAFGMLESAGWRVFGVRNNAPLPESFIAFLESGGQDYGF